MRNRFIIILLFTCFNLTAQVNTELILTKEQNEHWLENLKSKELKSKIELINQRMLADVNVYYGSGNPHGIDPVSEKYKNKSNYRPIYRFINESGKKRILLMNNRNSESILELTKVLNSRNISKIEVYNEIDKTAIYGARGIGGVIFITVKNDKTIGLIEEALGY